MKKMGMKAGEKILLTAAVVVSALSASAVGLSRTPKSYVVSNAHYMATFDLTKGGTLSRLAYPGVSSFAVSGRFTCAYDGQSEKYVERPHLGVRTIDQYAQKATAEVVREAADGVVLRFSWNLEGADKVVQTVALDDTPQMRFEQTVTFSRPIGPSAYRLFSLDADPAKAVFLPENRNFSGVWVDGQHSRFPRWKYLTDGRVAFGLVAPEDGGWDCFNFFSRTVSRDWGKMGQIELQHEALSDLACPGETTVRFSLLATRWKAVAMDTARKALGTVPSVQLCDLEPEKVRCTVGADNGLRTTLVNNEPTMRTVKVTTELVRGLGESKVVRDETLRLKQREMRDYRVSWRNDATTEWGVSARVTVRDENGNVLDRRADVTTVSDSPTAATMFYILNPGFCRQDGSEAAWQDMMRRQYVGSYEYYVWTSSVWDPTRKAGLSPVADEWEPMTESSAGYRVTLRKKFLQDMVRESHARGIAVYAWITGLTNYRFAYAYPDMFQYCRNGQLSIYAGKVHGKDRFAVAKLAPYTEEAARDWGDQLADSVDMFGWDGCRWDWSFLPCSPNDPLYQSLLLTAPEKLEWFNSKGESCYKLYPDQDELTAKLHDAWLYGVTNRHPKFVATWNMNASEGIFKRNPVYMDTLTKDGLGLFEYLLDIVHKYPTYEKWAQNLTLDTQRARKNGCQSAVGHMSNKVNAGTVSERLAKMACVLSGCKWWGGPMEYRYWGALRRSFAYALRFSEYFYSPEFRLLPEERRDAEVKVDAAGRKLFWQQFVFERNRKGGRDVSVGILNTDGAEYIVRKQAKLVPVEGLVLEVRPREDERLVSAHALLPGDEPLAVPLKVENGKVTVPRFEEAVTVVCSFATKGGAR